MAKAMKFDPCLFATATENLEQDFDLALLAFADSPETVKTYLENGRSDHLNLNRDRFVSGEFSTKAKAMLEAHETFCATVAMGISSSADSGSPLSLLNQGFGMAVGHKKLIAAFLDIPTGGRLHLMRRAYANVGAAMELFRFQPCEDGDY